MNKLFTLREQPRLPQLRQKTKLENAFLWVFDLIQSAYS